MKLKNIPLDGIHKGLSATMLPYAGYEMPIRYSSEKDEHLCVRNRVGVFDVSHMGEFTIKGDRALDLIQKITTNDASKLKDGQAQYTCMTNESGCILDDLLVYRISHKEFLLVVNASNIEKDWMWICQHNHLFGASLENISDDTVLLAVQGVKSIDTLQPLTDVDLSTIPFYHFKKGMMSGIDCIISATGYTGSGGFELYTNKKYATQLWKHIFESGKKHGIQPIGLVARDTLRLEMGFCLYGNDIDESTSPIEAGLGWITKFNKDFVGAELLKKQKISGVDRKLVGFTMIDKGIPRQGYELLNENGQVIGKVTSGTMSPSLNIGIGLGYVSSQYTQSETKIFVSIRNRKLQAQITPPPFYK